MRLPWRIWLASGGNVWYVFLMLSGAFLDHFDRSDLRQWFMEHAASAHECWVPYYRRVPADRKHVLYLGAVEEALCFGWIDSVLRRMDDGVTRQRFSPRRPGSASKWSELNKARCMRLERLGLMTDAGREAWSRAKPFRIDEDIMTALRADRKLWKRFCALPELYRRIRIDTIQIKRNQPALFQQRLTKFMECTRCGQMFGAWNDGGKLSDVDVPRE